MTRPFLRLKVRLYGPQTEWIVRDMSLWHALRTTILSGRPRKAPAAPSPVERLRQLARAISERADYADTCRASGRDADEMLVILSQWRPM